MNPLPVGNLTYAPIQETSTDSLGSLVESNENKGSHLTKTYGLFDLLCVGVGATVGSGVFVLTGLVARDIAGPGVIISWIIAGVACCLSATSFAELSSRFPSSTSSYSFARHTLGEWAAYLAAWGLSLECGLSAAAVARSWGRKLLSLVVSTNSHIIAPTTDEWGFNFPAFLLQLGVVFLFLAGKDVSKAVINIFTVVKVLLIFFMIFMGLYLFDVKNFQPTLIPMGWDGVLRGATLCFFGFVGYDEVCCLALETKHARQLMPRAVFGTIALVCVLYGLSSVSLVGMANYLSIDRENGYALAFNQAGYPTAGIITATGEMVMLPLVVILSFLPQPRILAALARDGLAPQFLATVTERGGNLVNAILFSGFIVTIIAAFVPFIVLNDLISAGVLLSFNFTNTALILLRCDEQGSICDELESRSVKEEEFEPAQRISQQNLVRKKTLTMFISYLTHGGKVSTLQWLKLSKCKWLVCVFHILAMVFAIQISSFDSSGNSAAKNEASQFSMLSVTSLFLLIVVSLLYIYCPDHDGVKFLHSSKIVENVYRTPAVPLIPLVGIFINSILIFQLSVSGLLIFIGYFCFATLIYVLQKLFNFMTDESTLRFTTTETNIVENSQDKQPDGCRYYHCPIADSSLQVSQETEYELSVLHSSCE